jgi:cyclopropane-fatty-acyl-phospholipid synthase
VLTGRVRDFVQDKLSAFPWPVTFHDWQGNTYRAGGDAPHWCPGPLEVSLKTERAARTLLSYDALGFLDRFLEGDVDLTGNLYLLTDIKRCARFDLKALQKLPSLVLHRSFQNLARARVNVKSHYDIPQEALNVYLDRVYRSYSCGLWEDPARRERADLLRIGQGERDAFDSLEKAQWRKFKDAADFIDPRPGETLLDVGCGYGGQLRVALENYPFGKVVGWTLSENQRREGVRMLAAFDPGRWETNEGDYRQETRVFDHVTSTGMICHVGPRGLAPYIRNVRSRIKKGGRYLHHCMMLGYRRMPHDWDVGILFNKKYVWPGFHWFTPGTHVRALEQNGFRVRRMVDYSEHYAKTTAAWYERMMAHQDVVVASLGEPTFRAWQIFLAGVTSSYLNGEVHLYRVYCEAV